MNPPRPRSLIVIRWCPVCGRESATSKHLKEPASSDTWCPGKPISLNYNLSPIHEDGGMFPVVRSQEVTS